MLDLKNKHIVVVGGGKIASRRISSLLESEARITVISPEISAEINQLHTQNKLTWKQKPFTASDVENAFLVVIATNQDAVNKAVEKAIPDNCLINAAHHANAGNLHFPASVKRGNLIISVSTSGASPMLAKKVKKELASQYDNRYEAYLEFLFEARNLLKEAELAKPNKDNYLRTFLHEDYLEPKKQEKALLELSGLKKEQT